MKWDQEKYSIEWWQKKLREDGLPEGEWFAFEQNYVPLYGCCRFFSEQAMYECLRDNDVHISFSLVKPSDYEKLISDGLHCATFITNYVTEKDFRSNLKVLLSF